MNKDSPAEVLLSSAATPISLYIPTNLYFSLHVSMQHVRDPLHCMVCNTKYLQYCQMNFPLTAHKEYFVIKHYL